MPPTSSSPPSPRSGLKILDRHIDKQKLALGQQLEKKTERDRRRMARARQYPKTLAARQIAVDQCRRGSLARLARLADDKEIARYTAFAQEIRRDGFNDAVLLGMGGSSLGPEVLAQAFGSPKRLAAFAHSRLDHSGADRGAGSRTRSRQNAVHRVEQVRQHDRAECVERLFLQARRRHGRARTKPGGISSPSPILDRRCEKRAEEQNFRHIFHGVPSIGGRYSVLSPFGLVPAAIAGIDVARLMRSRAR